VNKIRTVEIAMAPLYVVRSRVHWVTAVPPITPFSGAAQDRYFSHMRKITVTR
jgi:hypothetical protein